MSGTIGLPVGELLVADPADDSTQECRAKDGFDAGRVAATQQTYLSDRVAAATHRCAPDDLSLPRRHSRGFFGRPRGCGEKDQNEQPADRTLGYCPLKIIWKASPHGL